MEYKKIEKRLRLPNLGELKKIFNFEIEKEENNFNQIRKEISEKLFDFSEKIIEPIIYGSDSFCSLFEENMITEEERERVFEIYKKIQSLKWENNLLLIRPDEIKSAKWIKKAWNLWKKELENELVIFCKKLSANWKTLKIKTEKTNYHI